MVGPSVLIRPRSVVEAVEVEVVVSTVEEEGINVVVDMVVAVEEVTVG